MRMVIVAGPISRARMRSSCTRTWVYSTSEVSVNTSSVTSGASNAAATRGPRVTRRTAALLRTLDPTVCVRSTTDPLPRRDSIQPSPARTPSTRWTVSRETPYFAASSRCDGSRAPSSYSPSVMSASRALFSS